MASTPHGAAVIPLGHLPGDRPAGAAAYAAAGIGVVSAAALAAMFAVEVPRGGPYVFGGINDFTGGLFFAASIPAIVQIHRRLGQGPGSRLALGATVAGSGAAAVSSVLLSLHLVDFTASTAVTMAGILGQAVWTAVANHKLAHRAPYPPRLARAGRALGTGMVIALPVVSAGYAAAGIPALQTALFAVGGAVGAAAYLAWPIWLAFAGRQLTGAAERRAPMRQAPAAA
ncbi:hypothetical protein [Sinomonas halotolerans]|uniref:Uncharacterized protein n=1 Tax=Sinomonas halotolerans TaxID=1644133 RepID=A0ABU9X045_9MICC